jgi:hypothetical protein
LVAHFPGSRSPVSDIIASDSFSRSVVGGWGSAAIGGAYRLDGPPGPDFSVSGGVGTMTGVQPGAVAQAYLPGVSAGNVRADVELALPSARSGDSAFISAVLARRQQDGTAYAAGVAVDSGSMAVVIERLSPGSVEILASWPLDGSVAVHDLANLYLNFQVTGTSPVTLQARLRTASGTWSPTWSAVDASAERIGRPGSVGLANLVNSAPSALTFGAKKVTFVLTPPDQDLPSTSGASTPSAQTSATSSVVPVAPPTEPSAAQMGASANRSSADVPAGAPATTVTVSTGANGPGASTGANGPSADGALTTGTTWPVFQGSTLSPARPRTTGETTTARPDRAASTTKHPATRRRSSAVAPTTTSPQGSTTAPPSVPSTSSAAVSPPPSTSTSTTSSSSPSSPSPTPPSTKPPGPAAQKVVLSADFDSEPLGAINPKTFLNDLGGSGTSWAPTYQAMSIVANPSGSGRAVRNYLQKGTIRAVGENGVVLPIQLPGNYDSACVSYDLMFDSTFDWSMGGKLPGLLGVAPGVPPDAPTGGHPTSEGWSGRVMWLGPGASNAAGSTATAVNYMYHPGQASQYGDDIPWNVQFTAGRWTAMKVCYTMNTVGKSDGVLQAWMDGKRVVNITNFVYRTRPDVHINYLEWDVFRGGATLDWAGSHDDDVYIDNMVVTAG